MERMNKGDLLQIGTAYVEVHTFKGNDYVTVKDFSTTTNALSKEVLELEKENKELKEKLSEITMVADDEKQSIEHILELEEENKKLNEEIENHKQNIMQDELEIIPKLEEEIKKLKSDLAYERTMLDNVRAEYKSSQNVIKKLKEELRKYKKLHKYSNGELLTYSGE